MKLNEQDSLFDKQLGNNQRRGYLIRSCEKLKQIHKQRKQLSQTNQILNKVHSSKKNGNIQKRQNQWNGQSDYSSQSSVIMLTPPRKHKQTLKPKNLSFLTQENEKSSSIRELSSSSNKNVFNRKLLSYEFSKTYKNNMSYLNSKEGQCFGSMNSCQIVSDDQNSADQIYTSMVLVKKKTKNIRDKPNKAEKTIDYKMTQYNNYIELLSSENKIVQHESSPEVTISRNTSQQEHKQSQVVFRKQQEKQTQLQRVQQSSALPLQQLESNIIQNYQTPIKQHNQSGHSSHEKHFCYRNTPFSSIQKRLFDNQQDFIGSQQENIDSMIRDMQSTQSEHKKQFKCSSDSAKRTANNKQHIVKVLDVVKMKNSTAKLAKVSVFIENVSQLQIKYVHTLEIRQTHPELLIQYYENAFDLYFLEIKELF